MCIRDSLALHQRLELLAGLGTDALEPLAAVADHHALVGVALDDDARADAAQLALFLELWVKVRSGWADDEAHLRSYGYE